MEHASKSLLALIGEFNGEVSSLLIEFFEAQGIYTITSLSDRTKEELIQSGLSEPLAKEVEAILGLRFCVSLAPSPETVE